eukprot:3987162-Pyramimonas_sp.AAC.1
MPHHGQRAEVVVTLLTGGPPHWRGARLRTRRPSGRLVRDLHQHQRPPRVLDQGAVADHAGRGRGLPGGQPRNAMPLLGGHPPAWRSARAQPIANGGASRSPCLSAG